MLAINNDDAITALRYFHWNAEKLKDTWFDSEDATRKLIGITCKEVSVCAPDEDCPICYASFMDEKALGMSCGHKFCADCWKAYLEEAIRGEASKALRAPCQQHGCNMIVPHSLFVELL
jgi:ariadne-1